MFIIKQLYITFKKTIVVHYDLYRPYICYRLKLQIVLFLCYHDSFFFFFSDRKLPLKEENGKEALNPENIEIKVANDIIQSKEDDSKA